MTTAGASIAAEPARPLAGIFSGGLIGGSFDLAFAMIFNGLRGVKLIRIPQSIASGVLGMASFQGGIPTAAFGVFLHYVIALGAAATYYMASRKLTVLRRRAALCGIAYGVLIYLFMNWIVLPLSAAPKFRHTPVSIASDLTVHMLLIGLSIVYAARRFGGPIE